MRTSNALLVFLFYLLLAIVFTAPISLRPGELAVNDGDPLHISWILAWDAHQLVRDPLHLFDSNTFYPYASSLAFSEHMIVPALLAAPFFYASGNALLAQNLAVLLTLALSAWAMYMLAKEILGREDAAVVAGLVYVFHTYNFHEVPRLQLLSIQWWPLALLFLHRGFIAGGWRNAFLFGLFFLLQGLSCTYYLFYFALVLAFWIPAYVLFVDGAARQIPKFVPPLALSGAVFALVSIPYRRMLREFNYERALAEGLDLLEYLRPPEGSFYAGFVELAFPPSVVPQFLGFLVLALALVGFSAGARHPERSVRLFFWLSVMTVLLGLALSLGPTVRVGGAEFGRGPYALLYDTVPFFRVLRNAERMSLLVHFGLAILAGFGAEALFNRMSNRIPRLLRSSVRIAVPVLLFLEHFHGGQPFVHIPTGEKVPEVFRYLSRTPDDAPVVELPVYPYKRLRLHSLYPFYSTVHWKPIVFGRTSFYPPATGYLAWELRHFPDADSIGLLEGLGVGRVVVHPNLWPPEERRENLARLRGFTDRLIPEGRFPPLSSHAYRVFGFGDERVYRLASPGEKPSTTTLCTPADEIDPSGWRLSGDAVTPHEWAVDRDPATKWRTDRQLPGLKLDVDLGREEIVAAVGLTLGYPFDQFPRDLSLKVRPDDGRFQRVVHRDDLATKWELVEALLEEPANAAMVLRFEPVRARRLRFWVREGKEFDYSLPHWSLPELHVYRSCIAADPPG